MSRKAKAWRGWYGRNADTMQRTVMEVQPGIKGDCVVIPKGAPLPMTREVRRVVRLLMAEYRQEAASYPGRAAEICAGPDAKLWRACAALDRARKGKRA